nr:MAG TPA: ChiA1-BD-binding domain protein [Caudoviricetes sp.]
MYEEIMKEFKIFRDQVYARLADYDEILRTLIGSNAEKIVSTFTDENALKVAELYPVWATGITVLVGDRYQYNDKLYKCVQAHTTQADWTPDVTPALWVEVSLDEFPEWKQPAGAHDAYAKGDKVKHNGKKWESTADANVWEPGVYGWSEIVG